MSVHEYACLAGLVCTLAAGGIAPAQTEVVLHNFGGPPNALHPYPGVIRDLAANLFGVSYLGGPAGQGFVFELDATGHRTVLHGFTGGTDGGYPYAGVIVDSAGNLYGTASSGGTANAGVVFKVDMPAMRRCCTTSPGAPTGRSPTLV